MSASLNDTPTRQEMTSAVRPVVLPMNICGSDGEKFNACNTDNIGSVSSKDPGLLPEIKHEPPEDIDDIPEEVPNSIDKSNRNDESPKIRLTPTIKLMPVSNPVDPKRRFSCPYDNCTKSYGKSSHLRSHLTWHTGVKPFVCTEINCGKGFTRSDELNRHLRTHTGEKPFECIQCTKKFSRSDHLTKHLATHAKQMQNCIGRSKKERTQADGSRAKKGWDLIETSVKSELFEGTDFSTGQHFMSLGSITQLKTEGKAVNENLTEVLVDHTPLKIKLERPINSEEYHVVSPSSTSMKDLSVEKPIPNNYGSELEYQRISKMETPFNDGCKSEEMSIERFPTTPESKNLESVVAPTVDVSDVSADGAFMGWPKLENGVTEGPYDPHRPWRCKLCTKSFKRQDDLNRHLRTHTGEKPFACFSCERRFMRSDHLKKHLKTHTNMR